MLLKVIAISTTRAIGRTIEMIVRGSRRRCDSGGGGADASWTPG